MQKVNQESCQQNTHRRQNIQNTMTNNRTGWEGSPYSPNPDCPVCKGFGFAHTTHPDGTPNYASTIPCRAEGCLLEVARAYKSGEATRRRQEQSGLHTNSQTFDNFKLVAGAKNTFKLASELATGEAKFVWLLIYGGVGNGKTFLCNAITKESLERGIEVIMLNAAGMFSQIKAAMNDNTDQELIKRFKEVPLLIIDDWGVEYGTDWQASVFDEILDARYWPARATVVTTNKDIAELPKRVLSRFNDKNIARVVHNSAADYRKR